MDISKYVLAFEACDLTMIDRVGGKCASLGELLRAQIPVPPGYAITTEAYLRFIEENGLTRKIIERLEHLDHGQVDDVNRASADIRALIDAGTISEALEDIIAEQYRLLSRRTRTPAVPVAVRSSATAEDLPDASFAGQQETYLWVRGVSDLLEKTRRCWSSLFTPRAISVQVKMGIRSFQGLDQCRRPKNGEIFYRRSHVHSEPLHRRSFHCGDRFQLGIRGKRGFRRGYSGPVSGE